MLPTPTQADLEVFTGRPAGTFGAYADQALAQATLMFTIVTKLTELPDDPDLAQLANNAILELADRILLEQPFQEFKVKPFSSETIGSYSYSRITPVVAKIQNGLKTGLLWWDLAVDELTVSGSSMLSHGGIDYLPDGLVLVNGTDTYTIADPTDEDGSGNQPYVRIS